MSSDELSQLIADYRLRDDGRDPNVILRVVESDEWILSRRIAPPLVAALDALDEGDACSALEILRHRASILDIPAVSS